MSIFSRHKKLLLKVVTTALTAVMLTSAVSVPASALVKSGTNITNPASNISVLGFVYASTPQSVPDILAEKNTYNFGVFMSSKAAKDDWTNKDDNKKYFTWKSNNPSVATVNENGVVSTKNPGTFTITATMKYKQGNKYPTVSKTYTVKKLVKTVAINKHYIESSVGSTESLKSTVGPTDVYSKKTTWKTSNKNIATVDAKGNVKAKGDGICTITCTAKDGSGVSDSCTVKVIKKVDSLVLNCHAIKWAVGKSGTFYPTVKGPENVKNTDLSWKSSNTKVATVNENGKLTSVGAGTCVITCTAKDGSGKSDKCTVTVFQPITKITLNAHAIKWAVGKSGSYYPKIEGPANAKNTDLTWKSSNTKVATVNANGKLTSVGAGTCTITCTAKDGSGKSDKCTVTVYQPVKGISLNSTSITLNMGKTSTLKASVSPSNATTKSVTWKTSNPVVAKVDSNGKVTATGAGTCTIICTAKDGSGVSKTCKVTVKKQSYTDDDLFCLAAVIWQEAGASYCSDKLQLMVASVVMNHVAAPDFPNTIRGVITRPGAYGTMGWTGVSIPTAHDSWTRDAINRCYKNAKRILEGERAVPSNVIYQAGFVQGSGIYAYREGMYFCYR